jgi:uncharacterized protein YciI
MWTPYTYLVIFTHPLTKEKEYYYGVKYGKNADPDTFWVNYFTTSDAVKYRRRAYGDGAFQYEIRRKFKDVDSAKTWEAKVLRRMHVVEKDEWLNRHDRHAPPNWSGDKNRFFGKEHTQKTKIHLSDKAQERWMQPGYSEKMKEAQNKADRTFQQSDAFRKRHSRVLKESYKNGRMVVSFPGEKNGMYGKTHGPETVAKMREIKLGKYDGDKNPMYGKSHGENARSCISNARSSSKWVHNGVEQKSVLISELNSYLDNGWKQGRLTLQGRKWVHDGNGASRCVSHDEALQLTYLGWFLGRG